MKNYHIPRINDKEILSADFSANIDGEVLPIKRVRVTKHPFNTWWPGHQRPLDQTEFASYANFSISGKVKITVRCHTKRISSVEIRPSAFGIKPEINGQLISFTIDKPMHFTVEVNGTHNCLHLFASEPENYDVDISDENVIYFGPGIHTAGLINLTSNQTLYLHESAVVYGSIYARDAENIKILGRGVIDSAPYKRKEEVLTGTRPGEEIIAELREMNEHYTIGNILMRNCKNIVIDGVIFRDPPFWSFNIYNCEDVLINDIKLIGLWRYNADGIDIYLGKNIEISNCFIRSFDDSVVARGACGKEDPDVFENMYTHDCVLWCEWGRAIELWTSMITAHMKNIFFKDCYIIRTCHVAMDLQIYNSGTTFIDNVICETIYVETDANADRPVYQKHDNQIYMNTDENYMPELIFIGNAYKFDKPKNKLGFDADVHYDNIIFKNIQVSGNRMPQSIVKTIDGYLEVKNVILDGIYFNGKKAESFEEMNLDADFEKAQLLLK